MAAEGPEDPSPSPFPSLIPCPTPFQVQHSLWGSVEADVAAAVAAEQQIDGVVVTEAAGIFVAVGAVNAAIEWVVCAAFAAGNPSLARVQLPSLMRYSSVVGLCIDQGCLELQNNLD